MTPTPDVAGAESLAGPLREMAKLLRPMGHRGVPDALDEAAVRITQLEEALREIQAVRLRASDDRWAAAARCQEIADAALTPAQPHQDASVKGRDE